MSPLSTPATPATSDTAAQPVSFPQPPLWGYPGYLWQDEILNPLLSCPLKEQYVYALICFNFMGKY